MEKGTSSGASHAEALANLARQRVVCLFARDPYATHDDVESWAASSTRPSTLVTLEWEVAPRLSDEFDETVVALARAAASIYPKLYVAATERDDNLSADDDTVLRAARSTRGVVLSAARAIVEACRQKQLPLLPKLARAERVRQLALALDPEQLVIELLVSEASLPARGALLALSKGAEWLANNSGARVVLVLPHSFAQCRELDRIASAFDTPTANASADAALPKRNPSLEPQKALLPANDVSETEAPLVSVAAPIGAPHPGSEAEILLHGKLTADAELAPLFAYNQLVRTDHGTTPRVDLLWSAGRLIIELDGHPDHARKGKFCQDRLRDYYLFVSGYRVLRLFDMSVLEDPELTVERIRTAVRHVRERNA